MPVLEAGQTFERYHVLRLLGNGSSGVSYEAKDIVLQRKVTLKLIHPWARLSDAERRQFFRVMQGISVLSHPYLAATLDYGEADGQLYTTHRYVSAGSLLGNEGRLWFRPPLPTAEAITYTHQLAQALALVHSAGHTHGSLTLSNILILRGPLGSHESTDFAPFLLADIEMAQLVRRFGQQANQMLPFTAAPEQSRGRISPASDQYALAALLYFWLAGRPPFLGSSQEIERSKLNETFPLLSSQNSTITFQQEGIFRRALSAYPEDRYPSILAFTEALRLSLREPQQAQPHLSPASNHKYIAQTPIATQPNTTPLPEAAITPETSALIATNTRQEPPTAPQPVPPIEPDLPQPQPEPEPPHLQSAPVPASPATSEVSPETEPAALSPSAPDHLQPTPFPEPQPASLSEPEPEKTSEVPAEADDDSSTQPASQATEITASDLAVEIQDDSSMSPVSQTTEVTTGDLPVETHESSSTLPASQATEVTTSEVPVETHNDSSTPPVSQTTEVTTSEVPVETDDDSSTPSASQTTEVTTGDLPVETHDDSSTPPVSQTTEVTTSEEITPVAQTPTTVASVIITAAFLQIPREVALEQVETTLGRAGSSNILLDEDLLTSRHHALIKQENMHYVIYDLLSTHGVTVNGQQLTPEKGHILADGDHIRIGDYELVMCLPAVQDTVFTATENALS